MIRHQKWRFLQNMASLQELKTVVKETLDHRGVLDQLKARIRGEVFNALDDPTDPPPPPSNENLLINELIREYLEFNHYKFSASVLQAEYGSGSAAPLERDFLAQELNIVENRQTASVPLLYSIVGHFIQGQQSSQSRNQASMASYRKGLIGHPSPTTHQTEDSQDLAPHPGSN